MRYILDSDGYIKHISFGSDINCGLESCTEYTGSIPSPHPSLWSWYFVNSENNKLHQWKIVDGELVLDTSIVIPEEKGTVDHVVEQGENSYGSYRIWASGLKECWISGTQEEVNTSDGGEIWGFYYHAFSFYFPISFTSPPTVVAEGGSQGRLDFLRVGGVNDKYLTLYLMNLTGSTDPATVNYWVYAKGT